mmetsp:Transcript_19056/g.27460  ORF Transcript_19056/g.27460 Transcript_19056/m.27460 type:complete len:160 (+) Transcript_19056:862-1341(+)
MTGEEVIMELEPMLATIMKKLDPSIQPFIDERGRLLVRLESIGFVANTVDQCVFNRTANGNQCTVTLDGVLEEAAVAGRAASPATSSLFSQSETQKLSRKETASFHSVVAKLLYLATKVKSPTHEDQQKVERVLKYLAQTSDKVLHRCGGSGRGSNCVM